MTKSNTQIQSIEDQELSLDSLFAIKGKKAVDTFTNIDNLRPYVEFVEKQALSIIPDTETDKGRKAIGSNASNVSKSKNAILEAINRSAEPSKAIVINAKEASKFVEDYLNMTRNKVLAPRREWQADQERKENERVSIIKSNINDISLLAMCDGTELREDLEHKILELEKIDLSTGYDEFTQEAMRVIQNGIIEINKRISQVIEEESKRKQAIELSISEIKSKAFDCMTMNKSEIKKVIDDLLSMTFYDFQEREREALDVRELVITQLDKLYSMAPEAPIEPTEDISQVLTQCEKNHINDVLQENIQIPTHDREDALSDLLAILNGDLETAEALLASIELGQIRGIGTLY